jgi:hypothetical protein
MGKLLKTIFGKAFAWLTGKFLGEVAVSAVVTLAMAGMFARPTSNPEKPVPPSSLPLLATAFDATAHWLDLPLDYEPTASLPEATASHPQPPRLHRVADGGKPQMTAARDDVPLPPPRPVLTLPAAPKSKQLVQAKFVTPTFAASTTWFCTNSTGSEAPCPPALNPNFRADVDGPPRPVALIPEARPEGAEAQHEMTLFGIAAGDLLPSPRHVLTGVVSVKQTLAGLTNGFR